MKRLRINNKRFSVRFVHICKQMNIKTVGQACKIFFNCKATLRIHDTRVNQLQKELRFFIGESN